MRIHRAMVIAFSVLALVLPSAAQVVLAQTPTLPQIFQSVDPAVVEITTATSVASPTGPAGKVSEGGIGSGVLISTDGRIMTASHVVQAADQVTVRFVNGETVSARVVASEPSADLALIQAERVPEGIPSASVGNSDDVQVGDQIFIVGAPFGIGHSLSVGHISARRKNRQIFAGVEPVELLQTDAAINRGNSGGPMFSMNGEVVGIVSHILSTGGGSEGVGFVITSNVALSVLIDEPSPWTGLDGLYIEGRIAQALNVPQSAALLVEGVAVGSPAAAIGLRPGDTPAQVAGQRLTLGGDVILAVNGVVVGTPDFAKRIDQKMAALGGSDQLKLRVLRDGNVIELSKSLEILGIKQ